MATEIYYTGYHPYTLEKIYTPKTKDQKLAQRKYFFWYNNDYKPDIIKSLRRLKREDLLNKLYPAGLGSGGGNNSRSQMPKSYNPNFNKKGRR